MNWNQSNKYILPIENIDNIALTIASMGNEKILKFLDDFQEQIPPNLYNQLILALDSQGEGKKRQIEYLEETMNRTEDELLNFLIDYNPEHDNTLLNELKEYINTVLMIIEKLSANDKVKYLIRFKNDFLGTLYEIVDLKTFYEEVFDVYIGNLQEILPTLEDEAISDVYQKMQEFEVNEANYCTCTFDHELSFEELEELLENKDETNNAMNSAEDLVFLMSYKSDSEKLNFLNSYNGEEEVLPPQVSDQVCMSFNDKVNLEQFIGFKIEQLNDALRLDEVDMEYVNYLLRTIATICFKIGDDCLTENLLEGCYRISSLQAIWFIIAIKDDHKKAQAFDKYHYMLREVKRKYNAEFNSVILNNELSDEDKAIISAEIMIAEDYLNDFGQGAYYQFLSSIQDDDVYKKYYEEYGIYLDEIDNINLAFAKEDDELAITLLHSYFEEARKSKQISYWKFPTIMNLVSLLEPDDQLRVLAEFRNMLRDKEFSDMLMPSIKDEKTKINYINANMKKYNQEIRIYSKNRKNFM